MKKILALILLIVVSLTLFACQNKEEESSSSSEESSSSESSVTTVKPSPSSSSSSSASSSSSSGGGQSEKKLNKITISLDSSATLKPGDTATINVFAEPTSIPAYDIVNMIKLSSDFPSIGKIEGPILSSGSIQYQISGLVTGSAQVTVSTNDGKVKSNPLMVAVVAIEDIGGGSGTSGAITNISINADVKNFMPGDTAVINVMVEPFSAVNEAAGLISLNMDSGIGTVSGPMIRQGYLEYTISNLAPGTATVSVGTKDGSVMSGSIVIAVASN